MSAGMSEEYFVTLPPHVGSVLTDRFMRVCPPIGFEHMATRITPDTWTTLSLVATKAGAHLTIFAVAENTHTDEFSCLPVVDPFKEVFLRMA